MKGHQKFALYHIVIVFALIWLFQPIQTHAAGKIYIAVYNENGGQPGIWIAEDLNADGDALDNNETRRFASGASPGYVDVVVDEEGVVYAISAANWAIYRFQDKNKDDDALDTGERTVFRDLTAQGLILKRPQSLAATRYYDPKTGKSRTRLFVMDITQQLTARLEDMDGDGDAQGGEEVTVCVVNSSTLPFTASRMEVDDLGRLMGVNPNTLAVYRVNDMNGDGSTEEPNTSAKACSPAGCGPFFFFNEFQTTFGPLVSSTDINPYGLAWVSQSRAFLSESRSQWRVHALHDLNGDEDFNDANEIQVFYAGPNFSAPYSFPGYDVVWGDDQALYYGLANPSQPYTAVLRLKDLNNDGDAKDAGEAVVYTDLTAIGKPVGLAVRPKSISPRQIQVDLPDESKKGPLFVLKDGVNTPLSLTVIDRETGAPVKGASVGGFALHGCLQVCPATATTDSQGKATFSVFRLEDQYLGDASEALHFRVVGDDVTIEVISTSCDPAPVAEAGPDQSVLLSQSVILDGSASQGPGLRYCWKQTGGTDVELHPCDDSTVNTPSVSFTAPASPASLQFELQVWNACDIFSKDMLTISVGSINTVLSVSPSVNMVGNAAGATTFNVGNSGAGTMNWTAQVISGSSWLEIISGSSGSNTGSIVCTFTANPDISSRTGTVQVSAAGTSGSPQNVTVLQAGSARMVGVSPGIVEISLNAQEVVELMSNSSNTHGDTPSYEWFLFMATIGGTTTPFYLISDKGVVDLNQVLPDLYNYTFTFDTDDITRITTLSMQSLGLSAGDLLAYGYAYQNQNGVIFLDNVVVISVY